MFFYYFNHFYVFLSSISYNEIANSRKEIMKRIYLFMDTGHVVPSIDIKSKAGGGI